MRGDDMASLDQLNIQITANAKDASDAINTLVTSLQNLNKQLGLKDGTKLTKILETLAQSARDFSGAASSVNGQGFENAAKGMDKAAESAKKATEQAEKLQDVLNGASNTKFDVPKYMSYGGHGDFSKIQNVGFISDVKELEHALPLFSELKSTLEGIHTPDLDAYFNGITDFGEKMLPAVISVDKEVQHMLDMAAQKASAIGKEFNFDLTKYYSDDSAEGYFRKVEESAQKTSESVKDIFANLDVSKINSTEAFDKIITKVPKAKSAIEEATEAARKYKQVISDMESGRTPFNKEQFDEAVKGYEKATEAVKAYKNELLGIEKKPKADKTPKVASSEGSADVLENLVALGEALEKLGSKFDAAADKGVKLFKLLTTPLKMATEEYKEKFDHMAEIVSGFQQKFRVHMAKIAQFWKRTMKTFTFMLVRKAITAIIKEVGNAVQSLAMYSNAMGTAFNTDISNMVADFHYLGRSIVSVFAPLINMIAPIIDAIVSKIATLLSYIGMLFAALGGNTSFTKAKKNVGNYAESLDDASKSAKNLTMGIDELNILNDQKSGSSKPYDGFEDAWEEVSIPDWINNLADKLKNIWDKLLAPLKEAWARVKENFLLAWQSMIAKLKTMFKAIGDAFLEVWNEEKTIQTIQKILNGVANLMLVVGNLAENFTKAWEENKRGVQIFEKMRDIVYVLATHFENLTSFMYFWSQNVTFDKLLDSVIELLGAFEKLADFLGGVFYDVMTRVVLKNIEWLIEEGIPHLNETISEVINRFDFDKIRQDLQPLEDAIERLLENIDKGTTNALGNLGKQIADFTNSQEFTDFLQRLADIMDLLSAEDVEKILTGIGEGILSIAESVVKFVNSDAFMAFLEALDKWLENADTKDIANIFKGLATAIGLFKFAAFASEGLAGFLQFAVMIKTMTNLGEIASALTGVGAGAEAAGGGFAAFAGAAGTVAAIIAIVIAAVYSLTASYGGLSGVLDRLKQALDDVKKSLKFVADALHLGDIIQSVKEHFQALIDKLGNMKDFWDLVIYVIEAFVSVVGAMLIPCIEMVAIAFNAVIDIIGGVIDVLGGLATAVMGVVEGITTGDWSKVQDGFKRVGEGLVGTFVMPFADLADGFNTMFMGTLDGTGKVMADKANEEIQGQDWKNLPGVQQAGQDAATGVATSYQSAATASEATLKETTKTFLTNGLGGADEVDYTTTATTFNNKLLENLCGTAAGTDWATYGTLVNTKTGEEIINQNQPFTDANMTTATTGAEEFSSAYSDYFASNSNISDSLESFGQESGLKLSQGFNASINKGQETTTSALLAWFGSVKSTVNRQLDQVKALFDNKFNSIFTELDLTPSIDTAFANLTTVITNKINEFGTNLLGTVMPMFLETYLTPAFDMFTLWFDETAMLSFWEEHLLPWFESDKWDEGIFTPLMENIQLHFESFLEWWDETIEDWWNEHLINPWFTKEKWDDDIFTPLKENIYEHFRLFLEWWDETMETWWEEHVKPHFEKEKWTKLFDNVLEATKEVFKKIADEIQDRINDAKDAVVSACEEMRSALQEVLDLIGDVLEAMGDFGDFEGKVTFDFGGKFAEGGFPSQGSLFLANEAGAELVGSVGGRTAVASNQEITGIADAVYATGNQESILLSQLISLTKSMLDKDPVVIGDREIARMANNGQSQLGMSIIT